MTYQSYLQKSKMLLKEFEKTQLLLLRLNLKDSGIAFHNQMNQFYQNFKQISAELENFSFKNNKDQTLICKQIERLSVFLKEMDFNIEANRVNFLPFQETFDLTRNEIL